MKQIKCQRRSKSIFSKRDTFFFKKKHIFFEYVYVISDCLHFDRAELKK